MIIMESMHRHSTIETGSEREFGLVFAALFFIIAFWPLYAGGPVKFPALIASAVFAAVACLAPALLRPLNILWHKFGLVLGSVMVPLVMSVIFFLGVTPLGIVMRMLGKDLLHLEFEPHAKSYWIPRNSESNPMGPMKFQF